MVIFDNEGDWKCGVVRCIKTLLVYLGRVVGGGWWVPAACGLISCDGAGAVWILLLWVLYMGVMITLNVGRRVVDGSQGASQLRLSVRLASTLITTFTPGQ